MASILGLAFIHLTSRAQRLIEEFEEGESVREGIANVLLHLAVTWDNYSDGDEYWHGVTVDTLGEFATELTAPTLLGRGVLLGALAGVETAAVMGCGGGAGSRACTPHRSLHTAECPVIP